MEQARQKYLKMYTYHFLKRPEDRKKEREREKDKTKVQERKEMSEQDNREQRAT